MRRRITTKGWLAKAGGIALIMGGFGAFLLGFLTDFQLAGGAPVALMLAGGQMMILGTCLFCYQQLLVRSMPNEDAMRYQYDTGYEQGYRDRERESRPTLVDLDARRPCACGSGKAQKVAVKVGDRV